MEIINGNEIVSKFSPIHDIDATSIEFICLGEKELVWEFSPNILLERGKTYRFTARVVDGKLVDGCLVEYYGQH